MAFARWDPIRDLLAIQQRLDRFAPSAAGWTPRVDLHETPEAYVVTAELPGFQRADFEVAFVDGRLTLSGVRPERSGASDQYHRIERGHGGFSRTFHLPLPVDRDTVTADFRDGILTVTCPKSPDAGSRRIQIS